MVQAGPDDAADVFAEVEGIKADLRRLETLGKPVVAAINGAALGGGLEIALACHHRIAVDDPRTQLGLPEVTLGLLPGGGGVTRTVRMLGLADALMDVLLTGTRFKPAEAQEKGLVDELVATREELVPAAKAWIAGAPRRRRGRRRSRGTATATGCPAAPRRTRSWPRSCRPSRQPAQAAKGADYPAPRAILAAAVEGAQVDFETATRIESRYLTHLITARTPRT